MESGLILVDTLFDLDSEETIIVGGRGEARVKGSPTDTGHISIDNVTKYLELGVVLTIVFTLEQDFIT